MRRAKLLMLLLLVLLGRTGQVLAQTPTKLPILKGRVLDAKTGQPVPYASIRLCTERTGTLANAQGHFELEASEKSSADTLVVEGLNYLLPHGFSGHPLPRRFDLDAREGSTSVQRCATYWG